MNSSLLQIGVVMPALAAGKVNDDFVGTHDHEGIVLRPMLNKRHQARWNSARALFQSMIDTANRENAMLLFNGSLIPTSAVRITEDGIYVVEDNCTFIQFEAKPDFDHGLYDKASEFAAKIKKNFVIVKKLEF